MYANRIGNENCAPPYLPFEINPSYFVFIWDAPEVVDGGEPCRKRYSFELLNAECVEEVIIWGREKADGRLFGVFLGIQQLTELNAPYVQLIRLYGEYPTESEYDEERMTGSFHPPLKD